MNSYTVSTSHAYMTFSAANNFKGVDVVILSEEKYESAYLSLVEFEELLDGLENLKESIQRERKYNETIS